MSLYFLYLGQVRSAKADAGMRSPPCSALYTKSTHRYPISGLFPCAISTTTRALRARSVAILSPLSWQQRQQEDNTLPFHPHIRARPAALALLPVLTARGAVRVQRFDIQSSIRRRLLFCSYRLLFPPPVGVVAAVLPEGAGISAGRDRTGCRLGLVSV